MKALVININNRTEEYIKHALKAGRPESETLKTHLVDKETTTIEKDRKRKLLVR